MELSFIKKNYNTVLISSTDGPEIDMFMWHIWISIRVGRDAGTNSIRLEKYASG